MPTKRVAASNITIDATTQDSNKASPPEEARIRVNRAVEEPIRRQLVVQRAEAAESCPVVRRLQCNRVPVRRRDAQQMPHEEVVAQACAFRTRRAVTTVRHY